tara:strand:- start:2449 stop:2898 length:450 start_codon:yes stop_codon:yes gene_type:complete
MNNLKNNDIELFKKGLINATSEFYLDAIEIFNELIENFSESELVDDAYYNMGLCYFNMNQMEKALGCYKKVIDDFPNATITSLETSKEFGKTAAKCHYGKILCFLLLSEKNTAKEELIQLEKYPDSYIIKENGEKITYHQLAEYAINKI